jgi:nucleoside-diphosphate-sugar epimerase
MTDSQQTTLVLGGTGRTGSLVARKLIQRGLNARTGGPVTLNDIDADAWIGGAIAAGFVTADYAVMPAG